MRQRRLWATILLVWAGLASAAAPQLDVPSGRLGAAGSVVPANLLINLSLTFEDAGAAYRGAYERGTEYAGYFNPRLCYLYPAAKEPDLDERSGHFSPATPADGKHECRNAFSGNFMNWATTSTLDLLRSALTGGDRVLDETGLTVLQRAWLPDGRFHPDFYASALYFPRKSIAMPAAVTPFPGDILYIVSCRNRVLFSATKKGSSCDAPRLGAGGRRLVSDKYFGEFNVRVSVCSGDDTASRPALCRPYPGGAKPEGSLQQAAPHLRVGVMSYLTEHGAGDPGLYGGVLRAPLKFIGAVSREAPRFEPAPNAGAEWQARSGILLPNPDRATGTASGAVNYINLLGRSNAARLGAYKTGDPGAELYYEALRYLQGRAASTAAGGAVDDAFPVWHTRADPVAMACQRNVIATIGHAAFVDDRYVPGNTRRVRGDGARASDAFAPPVALDVMQAARRVGQMEADPARAHGNGAPRADLLMLDTLDDGPAGAGSYYLAGAAYWAHTNPVRPDKAIRVDSLSLELGAAGRARGSALYLAAKYGAFNDRNEDANPFITTNERRDHSEWSADGHTPKGFFAAAGEHGLVDAVTAMVKAAGAGRGASVANSAAFTDQAGRFVIQASYEESTWSGTVQRRAVRVGQDGSVTLSENASWDAADLLGGNPRKSPPLAPGVRPEARKLYTLDSQPGKSSVTIGFAWDTLPPALRALLDTDADALGQARTDFLRGDRRREEGQPGGVFRRRGGVLGDSIHSVPLVVGAPSASIQGAAYGAFHQQHKGRPAVAYVGAGDGMLHAFDVRDGTELFAYLPHALLPDLHLLSSPSYRHRPWVDGSPGSAEVRIGGRWRTVLVSGMGMGARGLFALDVSNPADFAGGMGALWEFTDKDDPAMGHLGSAPPIAKIQVGTKDALPLFRYFALVASGINSLAPDGSGALFLLALDKPASQAWQHGLNYYRIATAAGDISLPNALAGPTLAIGADGSARYAYAGDLQGRLWRFDLLAKTAHLLFEARDGDGVRQPVTHAPRVVFAPGAGYLVMFGTGKFIEAADLLNTSFAPQSFYAIHDSLATPAEPLTRAALAKRTPSGTGRYAIKGEPVDYAGADAKQGWYVDFPHAASDGERAAGSPLGAAGAIVFDTLLPGTDACSGPSTRSYVLDAVSGFAFDADGAARSGAETGELMPGTAGLAPLMIETMSGSAPRSATGRVTAIRTFALVRPQAGPKPLPAQQLKVRFHAGRLGWREVANWQELHDAVNKK